MYYFVMLPKLFLFIFSDKPEFWIKRVLNVCNAKKQKETGIIQKPYLPDSTIKLALYLRQA